MLHWKVLGSKTHGKYFPDGTVKLLYLAVTSWIISCGTAHCNPFSSEEGS